MILPRFYPVLPDAAMIARLVPLGVRLVQLRFKGDVAEIPAQIATALVICARHGAQLVVNDHWQAALDQGADFIHLGQEDLDTADPAAIARAGVRLGVSTHDRAELDRALALNPAYIALGPVWPTLLKQMPWRPLEQKPLLQRVRQAKGLALALALGLGLGLLRPSPPK